jgi:RimJ/RimL family protein N-acetyltransferase
MTPVLETPRLVLNPLQLSDADQIQDLFPHWEIVRYLSNVVPWPYPADGARVWCRDSALPATARGEQWHWTIRRKGAASQLIGCIGLMTTANDNRGFWIGLPWQRQGFAWEASNVVTDYWFHDLGFQKLRAPKAIANTGSRRISEKSGMRVVATETRHYVAGLMAAEIWEISADEWAARSFR